jgi:RHS repeat-associated protein
LISATKSGANIAYQYDGDGNRVSKTVTGLGQMTTRYLVDTNNMTGYAQVVEELDAANTVQVVYTYGLDLISQDRKNGGDWTISYYGYDATGTTRMLFDESGTLTDSYTYEAFGTIIKRTGTTKNAYLFHGEQYDADLGLYYLRARYMDINVGRFTTMDGYEGNNAEPSSLHKYCFASSNLINKIDPSGNMELIQALVSYAYSFFTSMPRVLAGAGVSTKYRLDSFETDLGKVQRVLIVECVDYLSDWQKGVDAVSALIVNRKKRNNLSLSQLLSKKSQFEGYPYPEGTKKRARIDAIESNANNRRLGNGAHYRTYVGYVKMKAEEVVNSPDQVVDPFGKYTTFYMYSSAARFNDPEDPDYVYEKRNRFAEDTAYKLLDKVAGNYFYGDNK